MLTELEIAKLSYPFRKEDHSFLQGFVYISEEAIGERIEKIDPEWSFNVDEMTAVGDSVVVRATMTIKGISRSGVGGNPIQREKEVKEEKNGKQVGTGRYEPLPKYTQADNGVNAFKSAATDAFKRCARLFGIGRYLLSAPKQGAEFGEWLVTETTSAFERLQKLQGTDKKIDTSTGEIKSESETPRLTPPMNVTSFPTSALQPTQTEATAQGNAGSVKPLSTTTVGDDLDAALDQALKAPEGTQWREVESIQLLKGDKGAYYRLKSSVGGIVAFSTTALTALGIDWQQCETENKPYPLQPAISVPYFEKVVEKQPGQPMTVLELDHLTAKGLLEQTG